MKANTTTAAIDTFRSLAVGASYDKKAVPKAAPASAASNSAAAPALVVNASGRVVAAAAGPGRGASNRTAPTVVASSLDFLGSLAVPVSDAAGADDRAATEAHAESQQATGGAGTGASVVVDAPGWRLSERNHAIRQQRAAAAEERKKQRAAAKGADGAKDKQEAKDSSDADGAAVNAGARRTRDEQKAGSDSEDDDGTGVLRPMRAITVRRTFLRFGIDVRAGATPVPRALRHFSELVRAPFGVSQTVVNHLFERELRKPTPIQMAAIPALMDGRDVLACAPTGSGKTLAFLLPMLALLRAPDPNAGIRALVVAPTRELAVQIEREAHFLMKGAAWRVVQHGHTTQGKDCFITTPSRAVTMAEGGHVSLHTVRYCVFDEGDKLWTDSSDFLKQIDTILSLMRGTTRTPAPPSEGSEGTDASAAAPTPAEPPAATSRITALFSATLGAKVERLARTVMVDPVRIVVGGRAVVSKDVDQKLVFAGNELGKIIHIRRLLREGLQPPALVFVQSIERAKELMEEIRSAGLRMAALHSKLSQQERDATVLNFRLGKIWILITTELMARGVDFKRVGTVINFDLPLTVESYIHRVGRTGRAGHKGTAITYFTEVDKPRLPPIARAVKAAGCEVEPWLLELKAPSRDERKRLEKSTPDRMVVSTRKRMLIGEQRLQRQMKAYCPDGASGGRDGGSDSEEIGCDSDLEHKAPRSKGKGARRADDDEASDFEAFEDEGAKKKKAKRGAFGKKGGRKNQPADDDDRDLTSDDE